MAKILFRISCIAFVLTSLQAFSLEKVTSVEDKGEYFNKTEFRAAAFLPTDNSFRNVYGKLGTSLQIEQARSWKNVPYLELWGNVEWIFIDSSNCGPRCFADLDEVNFSIGLKVIGNVFRDIIYMYAGLGPDLGLIFIKNKMWNCNNCDNRVTIRDHERKLGVGGVAKSGVQFICTPNFFIDIFADYLYLPVHFHTTENVGGFKAGGALSARY